jgi:hypothetical protein
MFRYQKCYESPSNVEKGLTFFFVNKLYNRIFQHAGILQEPLLYLSLYIKQHWETILRLVAAS